VKATIANSIDRSLQYLKRGQIDYALAYTDDLAEHLERVVARGEHAEGSEEFTTSQLTQMEEALQEATFRIVTDRTDGARASLSRALAML